MTEEKPKLLIVEDDLGLQKQLKWCFDEHEVLIAATRSEAIAQLRRFEPPVVLQDLGLPPDPEGVSEGMATLREMLSIAPLTKVIVVTGNHDRDNAIRAVSLGAYDFYSKPVDTDVLRLIVSRAFHIYSLEEQIRALRDAQLQTPFEGMIATDDAMRKVVGRVEKVAPTDVSVLILGESGTGKELVARAVHATSNRKSGKFVAINCAAIPEQLLESELFGHEKGAFTGAAKQTIGKIETADGGTLFLDEIGDMSPSTQAKILRVLQEHEFERLGGTRTLRVDVRLIAATNRDLPGMVQTGQFREDLYYRLNVVSIEMPPLRERKDDIVPLAGAFIRRFAGELKKKIEGLELDAQKLLMRYNWPGNIRELENTIERAMLLAEGRAIAADDLRLGESPTASGGGRDHASVVKIPPTGIPLEDIERHALVEALKMSNWVQKDAAAT